MRHISLSLCGSSPVYSTLFQHSTQAVPTAERVMIWTTRGSGAPVFFADSISAVACGVFSLSSI